MPYTAKGLHYQQASRTPRDCNGPHLPTYQAHEGRGHPEGHTHLLHHSHAQHTERGHDQGHMPHHPEGRKSATTYQAEESDGLLLLGPAQDGNDKEGQVASNGTTD